MPPPLAGEVEAALREALGTQVKVQYKGGKGSLQVYFNSDEQLRRFANLLGKGRIRGEKKCWISNLCGKTRNW